MFNVVKGFKKEDLKFVAKEINEDVPPSITIADLKKIILDSNEYKDNPDFVQELLTTAIADRKLKQAQEQEHEKLKQEQEEREQETLKQQLELELEKARMDHELKMAQIQVQNRGESVPSTLTFDMNSTKRKFTLPRLEFRQFGDEIKDWLPFWSQFEQIHKDEDIPLEDKFQYLIQATVVGSRAREVVESFPPTGANYSKAIESLQSRFGREDILVEFYVRELLRLIISVQTKEKVSLTFLYDKLESYLRALESLEVTTEVNACILYPMVESCFPAEFLKAWNRSTSSTSKYDAKNRLKNLMEFLKTEVQSEERINLAVAGFGLNKNYQDAKPYKKKNYASASANLHNKTPTAAGLFIATSTAEGHKCIFCEGKHKNADCFTAQKMNLFERQKIVKDKRCCFACLSFGHRAKNCRATLRCVICSRKHVPLMCDKIEEQSKPAQKKDETPSTENEVNMSNFNKQNKRVFLQTLKAKLVSNDKKKTVRLLLDSGSNRSYISKNIATEMNYSRLRQEKVIHSLFGGVSTKEIIHDCYKIRLRDLKEEFACNFEAMDQEKICDDIRPVCKGSWIKELEDKNIFLSDISDDSGAVDILIGADIMGKMITGKKIVLSSGLVAVETYLGWTLMGKVPEEATSNENLAMIVTSLFVKEADISNLWRLDLIGIQDPIQKKSKQEIDLQTKEHFLETVSFNSDGRYEVSLPWSEDHLPLPSNKNLALKRLESITRKLDSEGTFSLYDKAFKEWVDLGIIEEVPLDQNVEVEHYLPHRPVFKENSTTKVRPVFDASAREKQSPSLNQCLASGPNLMNLIPSLLLKFRELRYGVVADIEKAFLMISINPLERDVLRFLWWTKKRELKIFRHARVVFGVNCSPFLLASVIEYHLLKLSEESTYDKKVLMKLLKSFYVDNVLASFSNQRDLMEFMQISKEVMKLGQFNLRGWEYTEDSAYPTTSAVLGLLWDRNKDTLAINLNWLDNLEFEKITKRTILSVAHKAFDPIGLVSPVFLFPKLLLQRLWKKDFTWDMEVDELTKAEFLSWYNELVFLKGISVPRWFLYDVDREFSVHTFCDASLHAYAAVVFIRVETLNGVHVHLLASKSRVTPVKTVTIPRLELIAATVGARLCTSVLNGLDWENVQLYFWSDSTTVLNWIQRDEIWATFVNNRVQEIRKLTEMKSWRHVPGSLNPADLPSRGCSGKQLLQSKWWEGPLWLKEPEDKWPLENVIPNENAILAERKKTNRGETSKCLTNKVSNSVDCLHWYYKYFSSYHKIVRMMAWIKRFIYNCMRTNHVKLTGELTFQEIDAAEKNIIKLVQRESFTSKEDKRLATLDVYEDEQGLLRLKTKIVFKQDTKDFRCPVILPSDHVVVKRLILEEHLKNCHAGAQMLLNLLREHYWILHARKAIRTVISRCVSCLRHKQTSLNAPAAALPENRTKDASIFEVVGVDLTGPLYLKDGTKAWICLYTCAVYRGVHLELLSSLSTEVFLLSFRRFIARRGRPSIVYCDNGTNFVGASCGLKNVDWNQIVRFSSAKRIQWIFNPPSAPWWGGFWERLIGVVKSLLKKVLGRSHLSYEQLSTILCDTESIINSRPLTYVSENSGELLPLSPSLFLQDVKQIGTPDFDALDSDKLNKKLKYRQKLISDLRARFRSEYLGLLVQRPQHEKWKRQIAIGDIVLIGCDNVKRIDWPLGRVIEVIPGKDSINRLVRLQTATSQLLRPIQRVFPLEVSSSWPMERKCEVLIHDVSVTPLEVPDDVKFSKTGRMIKVPRRLDL